MGGLRLPLFLLFASLIFPLASAVAQDDVGRRLQRIEKEIQSGKEKSDALDAKAKSLDDELSGADRSRVEIAKSIQAIEENIIDLEGDLANLNREEAAKQKTLTEGRGAMSQLLMALERMSRLPPQAVLAYPMPPSDIVRSAVLLRGIVPRIEEKAAQVRAELVSLVDTRSAITSKRLQLTEMDSRLKHEHGVLDHEIAAFRAARHQAESEREQQAQRLAKLTHEAEDLRELFGKLEEERAAEEAKPKAPPPPPPKNAPTKLDPHSAVASNAPFAGRRITGARGDLALPAVGRIAGQYGDTLQPGVTRKGIDIETHEGAQVVAPFDGKVVFAGPFRAYGLLLIIEHSEGYHTLLAGMSRIDAEVGQRVLSGEPVGVMGAASDAQPTLYVELRRNGQPINPLPWLAARKGKANG